ncbi:MAG: hypothetical protein JKY93_11720 [Gammaproteobacteria bacterium]|nr:hypothetical protein [Gammaproteobacteria bacterium]
MNYPDTGDTLDAALAGAVVETVYWNGAAVQIEPVLTLIVPALILTLQINVIDRHSFAFFIILYRIFWLIVC